MKNWTDVTAIRMKEIWHVSFDGLNKKQTVSNVYYAKHNVFKLFYSISQITNDCLFKTEPLTVHLT
jgi:hypothetical protein